MFKELVVPLPALWSSYCFPGSSSTSSSTFTRSNAFWGLLPNGLWFRESNPCHTYIFLGTSYPLSSSGPQLMPATHPSSPGIPSTFSPFSQLCKNVCPSVHIATIPYRALRCGTVLWTLLNSHPETPSLAEQR